MSCKFSSEMKRALGVTVMNLRGAVRTQGFGFRYDKTNAHIMRTPDVVLEARTHKGGLVLDGVGLVRICTRDYVAGDVRLDLNRCSVDTFHVLTQVERRLNYYLRHRTLHAGELLHVPTLYVYKQPIIMELLDVY